jgi:isoquinoline 1-oxidoreductase beta subunit
MMRALLNAASDRSLSRRTFLRVSSTTAGGLLVGLHVDLSAFAQGQQGAPTVYPPDAFVHIRPDGRIVITVNRIELGQGVATALPMILADELDADWSRVTTELAPAADVYKDPIFGLQMVGGSASIANSFQQYRELGAKTRAMLVAAAAKRWSVTPGQCRTADSVVYGPGGKSARYADLADAAARLPVPDKVTLKNPSQFRLIGRKIRRLDSRSKCDGAFKFAIDRDMPGMKIALLARPPVFGGRVKSFDDKDARSIAGVRDIFEIPLVHGTAIAVVADRFWAAKQGRDLLKIDWDLSGIEHVDSAELLGRYKQLARTTGNVYLTRGDVTAIDRIPAANRIVAEYEFPYLAHSPMEPLCMTARYDGDRAEMWAAGQIPTLERADAAKVLGLDPERVTYHIEAGGGAFGRRGTLDSHQQLEAAAVAKRLPGVPIKLVWTREDDVRGGYYRPAFVHRVEVGIGPDGTPSGWRHVVVGQSFLIGSGNQFESMLVKDGADYLALEGTCDTRYVIPNFQISAHHPKVNVPVLSWRSVGHTHNAFVMETLIDELATRARIDPIAYRLKLLSADAKKNRAALMLLQEKSAAWRNSVPRGHALGVAISEYHDTASACIADVSIENKRPRIHRVLAAVACGLAVNPLTVESQYQGGLAFGVTQLMAKGAITLKDGQVEQRNFDGYTPPYMIDAPVEVEVHIVPATDAPTGVGECPVPLIAPAVVNALARLTGKRYRTLPLVSV